jgi:hypothetical protein
MGEIQISQSYSYGSFPSIPAGINLVSPYK